MAELNAREMTQKARIATYKDAQLMSNVLIKRTGMDQSTGELFLSQYQETSARDGTLNFLIDTIEILKTTLILDYKKTIAEIRTVNRVPGVIMKKELDLDGSYVTYQSVEHNKCDLMDKEEFCKPEAHIRCGKKIEIMRYRTRL